MGNQVTQPQETAFAPNQDRTADFEITQGNNLSIPSLNNSLSQNPPPFNNDLNWNPDPIFNTRPIPQRYPPFNF